MFTICTHKRPDTLLLHGQWKVGNCSILPLIFYIPQGSNRFYSDYTVHFSHVITTGADGDIRIWNGVDDDDPNTQCVGEFILYHVYYDQRILTSTDLNTVQAYTYPDYNRDGTEFRFTAPVTCIKLNAKVIVESNPL